MKKPIAVGISLVALLFAAACENKKAEEERAMKEIEARRARQEAEARARAEATRKEMDALPKAFKTEPFFKLNKPEQPAPAVDQSERPNQTIEGKK